MKSNAHTMYLLTALLTASAGAQMSGTSHPEQTPIVASPEQTFASPRQAEPSPAVRPMAQTALRQHPYQATPTSSMPDPDGSIVETPAAATTSRYAIDQVDRSLTGDAMLLGSDPDAGIVTRVEGPANQLPAGSLLKVSLSKKLSTGVTAVGSAFSAELLEPVTRDGRVMLPAGSLVSGRVTAVHGGKRIAGGAAIHLSPTSVTLPDGTTYHMAAQVVDTSLYQSTRVDNEGTIGRRVHPRETVAIFALTTGSGAAAGGVFGGVPGALIGAGVGAGISTVMILKEDRQAELPAGTRIVFALTSPLTVGLE